MSWRSVLLAGTAEEAALIDQTARFILCYLSPFLFLILYAVVPSPYGKLITPTWQKILGPSLPAPLAWLLFELPNLAWAGVILTRHVVSTSLDGTSLSPSNYLLVGFFVVHYIRRALWYPLQMSPGAKAVPLGVVINALVYTSLNGYLQCQSLLVFQSFPEHWWRHPAFVGGLTLAFTGMTINAQTDAALRRLRHHQTTAEKISYSIPVGYWLFDYVSCPHYFGEILQWIGFAIASGGSVVAWSFVAFTAANLIPRAVQQHAWYQHQFASSYPVQRRAWLPFLW